MPAALRSLGASLVTAVPWCCIAPAVLALSGVATACAGAVIAEATPVLLVVSVAFLGRAVYLAGVRRSGRPWARAVAVVSAPLVVALWLYRFGLWFG